MAWTSERSVRRSGAEQVAVPDPCGVEDPDQVVELGRPRVVLDQACHQIRPARDVRDAAPLEPDVGQRGGETDVTAEVPHPLDEGVRSISIGGGRLESGGLRQVDEQVGDDAAALGQDVGQEQTYSESVRRVRVGTDLVLHGVRRSGAGVSERVAGERARDHDVLACGEIRPVMHDGA